MALNLPNRYPGRFNAPDASYPQGSFKNRTTPTAKDGSYLEKDWANDKEGFFQRLMLVAGLTANGNVDTATSSQYYTALLAIIAANSGKDYLNTVAVPVASAATVNLTTSAPDTRNISITGTATINGFTVAAGQLYFVRFTGAVTLTNSATLVTGTGANILALAGDTCIVRAVAADSVEILCYTYGVKSFSSGQLTIGAQAAFTLTHGLRAVPLLSATLVCAVAEGGCTPGDEVELSIDAQDGATVMSGMNIRKTASQLLVRLGNATNVFIIARADTGGLLGITPANWRLVITARRP